jgi:uncharacterized protein YoxC
VTVEEDIASVAEHLAELTRTVDTMSKQLQAVSYRADSAQERADAQQARTETQQERIDLAARELADVSERLQAAVNALGVNLSLHDVPGTSTCGLAWSDAW